MEYKNLITQSSICSEDFLEHFNLNTVTVKQLVDAFKYNCWEYYEIEIIAMEKSRDRTYLTYFKLLLLTMYIFIIKFKPFRVWLIKLNSVSF